MESDTPKTCSYCSAVIESDDFLDCTVCHSNVHIKCLKRPGTPGDLLGDVFFIFTCTNCSTLEGKQEEFVRQKLPWLMIITMAIYNLSIKSNGLSHHGHFHWRTHIVSFIDKHWEHLFEPNTKRRKKWIGSVSGALSHNSPEFFQSGQELFQESGWWKLTYNQTPKFYSKLYEQFSQKRQQLRNDKRSAEEISYSSDHSNSATEDVKRRRADSENEEEHCSRTLPYMGRKPKTKPVKQVKVEPVPEEEEEESKHLNSVQSSLMDFLAENLSSDGLIFNDIQPDDLAKNELLPLIGTTDNSNFFDISPTKNNDLKLGSFSENFDQDEVPHTSPTKTPEDGLYLPRILQVTNYQQMDAADTNSEGTTIKEEPASESENDDSYEVEEDDDGPVEVCAKSLFTKQPIRDYPWLSENQDEEENLENESLFMEGRLIPMSEYEEKELYNKLRNILSMEQQCKLEVPTYVRRFYRKLVVRELRRAYSKPLFNIDAYVQNKSEFENASKNQILDRYQIISSSNQSAMTSFHAKIAGSFLYEVFESPYTSRILHPFIYRNTKCFPPWMKLMCELEHTVTGKTPKRSTVDFCYVRPNHIAAVNALLQSYFWPGIDMSECLSYPDFSVVAMYKKLVVGCAFLVPDVGFNEAYISFMAVRPGWQRSGIASFMLYHLIQTCMSKDITLHVSATNPAVCLYQKFGFKIEEVILGFYEKYLPIDSKHSRHAFFLRLMR
ncbi:cysteine-rich protein 2-binding protein [Episyrphus balteatus]|uniref:cysteine-rich protein 2-binding protein n=1 Tax=Episyrphus balteatus TaxID=286459 RepID=UPI0024858587|nr:cysteine-rich protein 2-binding protein [Episyrphus balteatus]